MNSSTLRQRHNELRVDVQNYYETLVGDREIALQVGYDPVVEVHMDVTGTAYPAIVRRVDKDVIWVEHVEGDIDERDISLGDITNLYDICELLSAIEDQIKEDETTRGN